VVGEKLGADRRAAWRRQRAACLHRWGWPAREREKPEAARSDLANGSVAGVVGRVRVW
jgi:hypothetical protein